jgi:hypothetical protein
MKFIKKIPVTILLSTLLSLSGQTQVSLARSLYSVDKRTELQLNKFSWADTGTLKNSMIIKVFTDNPAFARPMFNQSLDCYTQSFLKNDTIYIIGYMIGQLGYGFKLVIFKDSCIVASFGLSDGKIYKYNQSDKDSIDFIPLPSISQKVILSKKPIFQREEIVAGLVEIKSVPFYYVRLEGKNRIELRAYFKSGPLKEIQ